MTVPNFTAGQVLTAAQLDTLRSALGMAIPDFVAGQVLTAAQLNQLVTVANNPIYGTATGGIGAPVSVTISGVNYQYLTFTSTGTLTVTKAGLFDVLLFGGGGAAPGVGGFATPGGGGGGISVETVYIGANETVTIGGGGSAYTISTAYAVGAGSSSQIGTRPSAIAALGGTSNMSNATGAGVLFTGSGIGSYAGQTNGGVDSIQGFKGGNSSANTNGGGGGGAAAAGGNGATTTGGTGGNGYDISAFIGGSAAYKGAGGGGGGSVTGGTAGNGGVAGTTGAGNAAAANSGGGGGGGNNNATGGNGGSGIVYIRWKV